MADDQKLKNIVKTLLTINVVPVTFLALALKKMNADWHEIRYLRDEIHDADRICPGFQLKAHPEILKETRGMPAIEVPSKAH